MCKDLILIKKQMWKWSKVFLAELAHVTLCDSTAAVVLNKQHAHFALHIPPNHATLKRCCLQYWITFKATVLQLVSLLYIQSLMLLQKHASIKDQDF